MKKTFSHNGATLTVRRRTVRDNLLSRVVFRKMYEINAEPGAELEGWIFFAAFLLQVDIEGELGIPQPEPGADAETLYEAYEALMNYDDEMLAYLLENAFTEVARPLNEDVLSPDVDEKKSKKTTSKKSDTSS